MPVTNYDYNHDFPPFEGSTYLTRELAAYGNAMAVIAKPSLTLPTPANYPNYLSYGRVLVKVGSSTDELYVSHPSPSNLDVVGITPATTTRRRRFISPTNFNPVTNEFTLAAGVAEGQRLSIVYQGLVWMFCENEVNAGDRVYFRYDGVPANDTIKAFGRLNRLEIPGETEPLPRSVVIRGNSNPNGGMVLVQLNLTLNP